VSPAESVERASQWLADLLNELSGLRNATSRDPSFKNWRQNALTALQRIWPTEQDHAERFRRIPFSPVDPRADMRAQRESFSRGCQEAARVLSTFIEEVRATGVPELPGEEAQATEESGFVDDFPTVDLPSGDLGVAEGMRELEEAELEQLPPQGTDPSFTPPPRLHIDAPPGDPALPRHRSTPPTESRPRRKGLGVAAKLRDLLGLSGLTEKPSPPPQATGSSSALPQLPPRSLDIVPVGDEVDSGPRSAAWPVPPSRTPAPAAPADASPATTPASGARVPEPPHQGAAGTNVPPAETGMSVVMSRPTTLRGNIGKVSIESLISPEFRGGAESTAAAPPATDPPAAVTPPAPATPAPPAPAAPETAAGGAKPAASNSGAHKRGMRSSSGSMPAPRAAEDAQPTSRPPLSIVPPLASDPEFNVDPAPPAAGAIPEPAAEPPAPTARSSAPSKVVPLPLPPGGRPRDADPVPVEREEVRAVEAEGAAPAMRSDSAELARATEDFMRTSPVLGATGRKVHRMPHESGEFGFHDPDAIAIVSMLDELTILGVPATRQSETRARLLDLARRMETDELQWSVLRKAVWFAMEYPEVARRLMPMLLPWIDRAA
jgi:hypothetical protein